MSRRRNAAATSSVSRVLDVVTGFDPAVNAPIIVGAVPAPYSGDEAALRTRSSAAAAASAEMGAITAVALTIHAASAASGGSCRVASTSVNSLTAVAGAVFDSGLMIEDEPAARIWPRLSRSR